MSDPRFSRLRNDPRFRKPKKKQNKIVLDDRFKSIFDSSPGKGKGKARVDKYGRPVSSTKDKDNLRRFYRLDEDDAPDYARGEGLIESSDEGEEPAPVEPSEPSSSSSESDPGEVILGRPLPSKKKTTLQHHELEIDLDESAFQALDSEAILNSSLAAEEDRRTRNTPKGQETSRLAVVNLDWDHVNAKHLFKIFASLVDPSLSTRGKDVNGKVLSVRVYPSEFGKERMKKEEREGPPAELFKKPSSTKSGAISKDDEEEEINETNIYEENDGGEYDEDALRTYQLERLRYYYAVVTCDKPATAAYIYSELDGTELERSANVFDLSFIPEDMAFDADEFRDEATDDRGITKGVEFVTDALRHSKVKLTWDDDDPDRVKLTRRTLSRKEIDEMDFKAYLASDPSSSSSSDNEDTNGTGKNAKPKSKSKSKAKAKDLRALLLGGNSSNDDDDGDKDGGGDSDGGGAKGKGKSRDTVWGRSSGRDKTGGMEITFTPGLSSEARARSGSGSDSDDGEKDETTLERYKKKQREKKRKRKEEREKKRDDIDGRKGGEGEGEGVKGDDFFGGDSVSDGGGDDGVVSVKSKRKGGKLDAPGDSESQSAGTVVAADPEAATAADMDLDIDPEEARHFDMRMVIKAEKEEKGKGKKKRRRRKAKGDGGGDGDERSKAGDEIGTGTGIGFEIDVRDERFMAIHDEPEFALDPSNPHFKSTKAMNALLSERKKRQEEKVKVKSTGSKRHVRGDSESIVVKPPGDRDANGSEDVRKLVESVKRKTKGAMLMGGNEREKKRMRL